MRPLLLLCWLGRPRRGQCLSASVGAAAAAADVPDTCATPFPVPGDASRHATSSMVDAPHDAADDDDDDEEDDSGDYEYTYDDDPEAATGNDDDYDYEYNDRDALFEQFNCDALLYGHGANVTDPVSAPRLRHLREQWELMRETYAQVKHDQTRGKGKADKPPAATGARDAAAGGGAVSSLRAPVRVGDAGPDKGRGVFATAPIPSGALVVDLDNGSTGFFKKRRPWRRLAEALPDETACNMLEWTFIQTLPPRNATDTDVRNGLTIFIAFDESNLMNNADWDEVTANIKCGAPPEGEGGTWGPCRYHYHAARDIAAGEELLISYGEFEDADQQAWFDIRDDDDDREATEKAGDPRDADAAPEGDEEGRPAARQGSTHATTVPT